MDLTVLWVVLVLAALLVLLRFIAARGDKSGGAR